jgi:hypothetical protein
VKRRSYREAVILPARRRLRPHGLDRLRLWKKIAFIQVSASFMIDVPLGWLAAVEVTAKNQPVPLKLLEVETNLLDAHAKLLGNRPIYAVSVLSQKYQNLLLYGCAFALVLFAFGDLTDC